MIDDAGVEDNCAVSVGRAISSLVERGVSEVKRWEVTAEWIQIGEGAVCE